MYVILKLTTIYLDPQQRRVDLVYFVFYLQSKYKANIDSRRMFTAIGENTLIEPNPI